MQKKYRVEVAESVEEWMRTFMSENMAGSSALVSLERIYQAANSLRWFPYRIKTVEDELVDGVELRKIQADKKYFIYFEINENDAIVNILAITFVKGDQLSQIRQFIGT